MYYIYEKSSTLIMGKVRMGEMQPDSRKSYKTMAAAKAALSRASKQWWDLLGRWGTEPRSNDPALRMAIAEAEQFHTFIERQRQRTNLMSGVEYTESVNTPAHMSPASETYWSM